MRRMRFLMPIGFLAMVAALSAVTMLLWNWLIPSIFGLIAINFWQALGLFILARILFGGLGFCRHRCRHHMMDRCGHSRGENPMHEKWAQMSPEKRKEFIEKRRKDCFGPFFDRGRRGFEDNDDQKKEDE